VEGPGCKSKETRGVFLQKCAVKAGLTWPDGSVPSDQNPTARVARGRGLAGGRHGPGSKGTRAVGSRSGSPGRAHAPRWGRLAGGGATAAAVQRRAAGATRVWRWGAPFAAGVTPGRLETHDELHGELKGRRRGLRAAYDGRPRRRKSGEGNPTARCTKAQTSYTILLLTSLRCAWGRP
jgi:hypothetical protein